LGLNVLNLFQRYCCRDDGAFAAARVDGEQSAQCAKSLAHAEHPESTFAFRDVEANAVVPDLESGHSTAYADIDGDTASLAVPDYVIESFLGYAEEAEGYVRGEQNVLRAGIEFYRDLIVLTDLAGKLFHCGVQAKVLQFCRVQLM
jgi:hypothetical protein